MKKSSNKLSFAKNISKKKHTILLLLIFAIMSGHFGIQMFLLESKYVSELESLVKIDSQPEPIIKRQPTLDELFIENASPKPEIKKTDAVQSNKPFETHKNVQPVKIIQRESARPSEITAKPKSPKKAAKNESKAERLRRVEQILTGF